MLSGNSKFKNTISFIGLEKQLKKQFGENGENMNMDWILDNLQKRTTSLGVIMVLWFCRSLFLKHACWRIYGWSIIFTSYASENEHICTYKSNGKFLIVECSWWYIQLLSVLLSAFLCLKIFIIKSWQVMSYTFLYKVFLKKICLCYTGIKKSLRRIYCMPTC